MDELFFSNFFPKEMAQIGLSLMLRHIVCFLISLLFVFEQMFIAAIAQWIPPSLVRAGFWARSWILRSWTWFPQMSWAWCLRECPAPVFGCTRPHACILLFVGAIGESLCTSESLCLCWFLNWTETLNQIFCLLLLSADLAVFICCCSGCAVGNRSVRLPLLHLLQCTS